MNNKYRLLAEKDIRKKLISTDHFEFRYDYYLDTEKYTKEILDKILLYRQDLRDCNKEKNRHGFKVDPENHVTWQMPEIDEEIKDLIK